MNSPGHSDAGGPQSPLRNDAPGLRLTVQWGPQMQQPDEFTGQAGSQGHGDPLSQTAVDQNLLRSVSNLQGVLQECP